jgi:hypothetical protein
VTTVGVWIFTRIAILPAALSAVPHGHVVLTRGALVIASARQPTHVDTEVLPLVDTGVRSGKAC